MSIYCVYFTTYSGQLMPPFYIGSGKTLDVLKYNYHGTVSSKKWRKIWQNELKDNPNLFNTEIVSLHRTRNAAYDAEEKYQRAENVIRNKLYINECFANKGFDRTGQSYSDEEKKQMSMKRSKNKWYNNGKEQFFQEFPPDETFILGRLNFNNVGAKIGSEIQKGKIWINNGQIEMMIQKDKEIPEGFFRGRTIEKFKGLNKHIEGTKWYNNGVIQTMSKIKPKGWIEGRLPFKKN